MNVDDSMGLAAPIYWGRSPAEVTINQPVAPMNMKGQGPTERIGQLGATCQ